MYVHLDMSLCNATHVRTFGYAPSVMPLMYVHLNMPLCNDTHVRTLGYAPM